ncbi:MAG: rRNA maturation RNase YbeY [Anaerolineaceae bacterium]
MEKSRFELAANETLRALGYENLLSVVVKLTGDREIQKLNKLYRGIDKSTDVLSFENEYTDPENGEHYLGDIMISVETAATQAEAHGNTLQHEIEMLLVHGVLHLAGHDHANKKERAQMATLQDQVLTKIGNPLRESIL